MVFTVLEHFEHRFNCLCKQNIRAVKNCVYLYLPVIRSPCL